MDFNIHVYKTFDVFGIPFRITESTINSWIICGVLILIAIIVKVKFKHAKVVPTGFQNVIELIVESFDNFTISTMGEKCKNFSSFYAGMFFYILLCNLSGLFLGPVIIGNTITLGFMRPPTADVTVTFALALITFFMVQGYGIKAKGVGTWLKGFTEPMWPLTPLNIIGELANPVSLSFRLFGNILGGTIIMGLFYNLPVFLQIGIPSALHGYFDIFAGVLQAFIFVMLSMTFVSSSMD